MRPIVLRRVHNEQPSLTRSQVRSQNKRFTTVGTWPKIDGYHLLKTPTNPIDCDPFGGLATLTFYDVVVSKYPISLKTESVTGVARR